MNLQSVVDAYWLLHQFRRRAISDGHTDRELQQLETATSAIARRIREVGRKAA